jgi:hypothetical protein
MKKSLVVVAAAVALLGADAVAAAPTPSYTIECVVGGSTTVNWSRAKLDQATLQWFTAGSTTPYASITAPITARKPKGSIVTSAGTGVGANVPVTVHVSFRHTGGGTDEQQAACA